MPLFGEPDAAAEVRVLSKREEDDAVNKVQWARYRGPMVPCAESHPDKRLRCRPVTWLKLLGNRAIPLCSLHKQEHLDRIALDAPRGSQ